MSAYFKQHPQVTEARVLAKRVQRALRRRKRLLKRDEQDVGAGPMCAGLRRAATELTLVDAHHLVEIAPNVPCSFVPSTCAKAR
jgi:hypothetical protein